MLCCIVAACFILRYMVKWEGILKYFGYKPKREDDRYGYREYCELDAYED